ncbi:MAG: sarcosine oxidase subunit delta [Phreatobacter sp.]|uniref:sarcosine oxidase subunit delta n=1 Tax=Phreatobacter sp. TaxID=1966341 RepID=UPI001A49AF1D|nr:sarcosine oxidase subunit delta [Phreatobacter sp.]MBL8571685.1 sarcosine oxidase subunit delta [Phreatobacter sp.]
MLTIRCPHCGERTHTEFTFIGDGERMRPADDASAAAWYDYVYLRDNRRGPLAEIWQHTLGCRGFALVERDLVTHAVSGTRPLPPTRLPGASS